MNRTGLNGYSFILKSVSCNFVLMALIKQIIVEAGTGLFPDHSQS